MGLGPVEYFLLAAAAASLGKYAIRAIAAKRAAAREAKAAASALEEGKIYLTEQDAVFAVVKDGKILDTGLPIHSHAEFVARSKVLKGKVPEGAEVVTITKGPEGIVPMLSQTYHGGSRVASQATSDAVRKAYK